MSERAACDKMAARCRVDLHWPVSKMRYLAFIVDIYGSPPHTH